MKAILDLRRTGILLRKRF